jgi:maltooligosyltrehalose trehalohydrolase
VFIVAENEPQDATLMKTRAEGGYGVDALYNDDFHHTARVAMTGVREAYYSDYAGTANELVAAVRWGFLFQGQYYSWQQQRRGTPVLDRDPAAFVACLENHDQVANSSVGRRLVELVHPGDLRAMTALLLLAPSTPLLFQGQELGSTAPWTFFADHAGDLGQAVSRGRREFLGQFPSLGSEEALAALRDPLDESTFEACRLSWEPDERGRQLWQLHHDLLALRRSDAMFSAQRRPEGACLAERTLVLRWSEGPATRLLLANLGPALNLARCAEPLLAPPASMAWHRLWSSEHPDYGGRGTPDWDDKTWMLPAHAALVLGARTNEEAACP